MVVVAYTMASMERASETSESVSLTQSNKMQVELMKIAGGDESVWVHKNSEAFRILLYREPILRDNFDQNPGECIRHIQKMLPLISEEIEVAKRTLH